MSWAFITAGAIYITWLMNNTGNSLLTVLLFPRGYNVLSVGYLPASSVVPIYGIMIILAWAFAFVVAGPIGRKWLGWKDFRDIAGTPGENKTVATVAG